jgi:hypothetical protein
LIFQPFLVPRLTKCLAYFALADFAPNLGLRLAELDFPGPLS